MPDVVYGETGNDVVLPCHFTSPHKNYMGNITVRWRKDEAFVGAHIFSCSNKNELDCKKSDSHYSFSGNLRKNDLSLKITAAKSDDAGKYFCRVELSNRADTFESSKGTELIISTVHPVLIFFTVVYSSGILSPLEWSISVPEAVDGEIEKDVMLPCSFTGQHEDMTVVWRIKHHLTGPIIFTCLSKLDPSGKDQNCSASAGRYSISGNRETQNISLMIKNARVTDEEKYYCWVKLEGSTDRYENLKGTQLTVKVPRVLESIYIRTYGSGEQFVTCDVMGRPPPVVTWIEPENISSSMTSVKASLVRASYSVPVSLHNSRYTCQISDEKEPQQLSLFHHKLPERQDMWIILPVFMAFLNLFSISFTVSIILIALYKNGTQHPQVSFRE
ncbi:sialic acid-binding Ig-like lectin 15 [Pygocentrus nattereri]|uniref:sialic acid-binding Ig-like lectin 15 n=1 Tax=Pygocentrus nattereri TaxID=42514 RepID=UPI001891B7D5|nr:sialic acid-binding Ig-like lectin 15 [Pygocentrus nattereri]